MIQMNLVAEQKRLTDIENKHGYKGERGLGRDKLVVWDEQTSLYKTDKEQGSIV